MTKKQIHLLLKRYPQIVEAIRKEKTSIRLVVSKKKLVLPIDDRLHTFVRAVKSALEINPDGYATPIMTARVCSTKSDIDLYTDFYITETEFYRLKSNFINKVFAFCILYGLVNAEEIL